MERADQGQLRRGGAERVPAEQRHDRLVDVQYVIAAVAQLAAHCQHPGRDGHEVRDGAIGGKAGGTSERDEPLGRVKALGTRAPVQSPRERVIGIERREDTGVVAKRGQLSGERLDMARYTTGVRPRIRRQQRDPHSSTVSADKARIRTAPGLR